MDKERMKNLKGLAKALGHAFGDVTLLELALTHGSYTNENPDMAGKDNERLEFLGDAVLQLGISDLLMEHFPDCDEGQLSKARAFMVGEQSLAGMARRYGIGDFILLGKGEEKAGGRKKDSILGDAFESIIGAIYLDGGHKAALSFILRVFRSAVDAWEKKPGTRDFKSLLQEISQDRFKEIPRYRTAGVSGPDHDRTFEVEASIGDRLAATGTGKSKKEAEQDAARAALEKLDAT